MVSRFVSFVAVLSLLAAPTTARPADAKSGPPAIVVRVEPLDNLIEDGKFLAAATGHEDEARNFDGFVKSLSGNEGLKGIDTKRAWGLYATAGQVGSSGVALIPITDQQDALDFVEKGLNIKVEKGDDGLYTVSEVRQPVYFRFANKYAYASNNAKALAESRLLDPAKVLAGREGGMLSLAVQLDQVPEALKQIALSQLELKISTAKDKKAPGETEAESRLKGTAFDDLGRRVASVVNEGGELKLSLNLDREAKDLSVELTLAGQSGSKLTGGIADLGKATSLFAGMVGADSALSILTHWSVPADLRKSLDAAIDEGVRKHLEGEKNEAKRALGEKFFKALEPSLKSGEVDALLSLRGPNEEKVYTFVAGVRLKEGAEVEKALRDFVKSLPEKDRDNIKLDAETAGDVPIHRIDAQKAFNADARRTLGDNPIYFAVRADAGLISGGADGLKAIKDALSAAPRVAPQFQVEAALARLAPLMVKDHPDAPAEARKVFGGKTGEDKVRFTIEGGKALKIRFSARTPVLTFLHAIQQSRGGEGKGRAAPGRNKPADQGSR